MLRGIEVLSSLQNITKPFYLKNLTREQSEDLGRAGMFHFRYLFHLSFLVSLSSLVESLSFSIFFVR